VFRHGARRRTKRACYYGSAYFPNDDAAPFTGALARHRSEHRKNENGNGSILADVAGVLSTGGRLVFTGDAEGNFIALEARFRQALWHFQFGASVYFLAMSFAIDGKQYVAVARGPALLRSLCPKRGAAFSSDVHTKKVVTQRRARTPNSRYT